MKLLPILGFILGLGVGVADAGHVAFPAPEIVEVVPNGPAKAIVTFTGAVSSTGYFWTSLFEDGLERSKAWDNRGQDLGYLPAGMYTADTFDDPVWSNRSGKCVNPLTGNPSIPAQSADRLWKGMGYAPFTPVAPFCYTYRGTTGPNGYNFAIYPFGTSMMFARPGDTLSGAAWSTWPSDQYSQIEISTAPRVGTLNGVMVRADSVSTMQGYICGMKKLSSGDSLVIYRQDHTSRVSLARTTGNYWTANVPIRCEAAGTTIRMLVNGTQVLSVTDTKYKWGHPGVVQLYVGNVNMMDNWSGGGLGGLRAATIDLSAPKPGQTRDYLIGVRVHDFLGGAWSRSPTSYFLFRRTNSGAPIVPPDTITTATVRLQTSANIPLFVDSVFIWYRVLPGTQTAYSTPMVLLGAFKPVRDTVVALPPMVRTWRYALFSSVKPTITGTLLGAKRDTSLMGKLQFHWSAP